MKLSIILPTFNERENIEILVPRLQKILQQLKGSQTAQKTHTPQQDGEILIIDDNSPDGTYESAKTMERSSQEQTVTPQRTDQGENQIATIRAFVRKTERGLSSAVLFGMRQSRGEAILVMDADLQHDENRIVEMVQRTKSSGADVCVGSRTVEDGSYGDFSLPRIAASKLATKLAHFFLPFHLNDPMSGFFIVRRGHYQKIADRIRPIGFKILLDILAADPQATIVEVPIVFKNRAHGKTKVGVKVIASFLYALLYYWSRNLSRPK